MKLRIGLYSLLAFAIAAVLIVSLSVQPVRSAELQAGATHAPWTTQVFEIDLAASAVSTAFGGPAQLPSIVSWINFPSSAQIGIFNKMDELLGNCGPDNEWHCRQQVSTIINAGTLSPVAEYTFVNTYKLAVAFETSDNWLYLLTNEYTSDGEWIDMNIQPIYATGTEFNVHGRPSVAFDDFGNAHVALVMKSSNIYKLLYIHESSNATQTCGVPDWQCDVIQEVIATQMGGQPTIVINASNNPRIIFYNSTLDLMFAYPTPVFVPGTCGPDLTWRCAFISKEIQSDSDMDMAIDIDSSQPHLAWTFTDSLSQTWVYHARYVGTGGNCGNDAYYNYLTHQLVYADRWECHIAGSIGLDPPYKDISIAVDSNNNPVIAYNTDNGSNYDLYVSYGIPGDPYSYQHQKVDGKGVNTGLEVDISLDKYDRGFIAYIEDREYEPTLKIAFQDSYVYLPLIRR